MLKKLNKFYKINFLIGLCAALFFLFAPIWVNAIGIITEYLYTNLSNKLASMISNDYLGLIIGMFTQAYLTSFLFFILNCMRPSFIQEAKKNGSRFILNSFFFFSGGVAIAFLLFVFFAIFAVSQWHPTLF
jgi:hypothetical protein